MSKKPALSKLRAKIYIETQGKQKMTPMFPEPRQKDHITLRFVYEKLIFSGLMKYCG